MGAAPNCKFCLYAKQYLTNFICLDILGILSWERVCVCAGHDTKWQKQTCKNHDNIGKSPFYIELTLAVKTI